MGISFAISKEIGGNLPKETRDFRNGFELTFIHIFAIYWKTNIHIFANISVFFIHIFAIFILKNSFIM